MVTRSTPPIMVRAAARASIATGASIREMKPFGWAAEPFAAAASGSRVMSRSRARPGSAGFRHGLTLIAGHSRLSCAEAPA